MNYKALFLDIDGTTVGYKQLQPTQKVIQAVQKANQYLTVCIATGRILRHAKPIIDQFDIRGLCVLDQGTQIYDPVRKVMIEELFLSPHSLNKALSIFKLHNLPVFFFDGKDLTTAVSASHTVSIYSEDFPIEKEESLMKDLSDLHHVSVHRMVGKSIHHISIEVAHPLGTKQHGIEKVAKIMGIETKEIIGVGDGYNDFPLLMACGLKIAMENAVPELRDIADFVAPSVDEDGVVTVIEKFVLS